nr:magnesium transporter NIPA2-like [Leptinotarsa decemlineata]
MDSTTKIANTKFTGEFDFYLGLLLSIGSSLFIGSSFILKKLSLTRVSQRGHLRAGAGGFGYLTDWMWWFGLITMGIGEVFNFAAYTFAPASLVTPLGALSVLVSALLASKFLNEKLNNIGKTGCLLCLLGSTMLVIHSPKEEQIETLNELLSRVKNTVFIEYLILVVIVCFSIFCYFGPLYGTRYVTVYILLCSAIGSITVMACKGLGLAIKNVAGGDQERLPNMWIPLGLLLTVIFCICIQMNYLNKALDLFSTSVVTPIYYVLFTTLVILASAILFEEWKNMSDVNIVGAICGFFVTVVAIFLLNVFKECNTSKFLLKPNSKQYGSNNDFLIRSV